MDNAYALEVYVRDRLANARAAAARRALRPASRRRRLRRELGALLISLGQRLAAAAPPAHVTRA
jgi:hypothetical protein